MSKIVAAANAMISNQKKINSVLLGSNKAEVFFLYDKKHKWSIRHQDTNYWLYYYPDDFSIEDLSVFEGIDWQDVSMVAYNSKEIGTEEASNTFAELYTIVKEKLYGVDEVLNEIIDDIW